MKTIGNTSKTIFLFYGFLFLVGIFGFLISLEGIQYLWEFLISSTADRAFIPNLLEKAFHNPLAGLFGGIVVTSLLQSSSTSIALIIATVASQALSINEAVYLVMGANIGTSVMNAIVAVSYFNRKDEFKETVPAALIDDIFKVFNCSIFFVLEITFGFLTNTAQWVLKILNVTESSNLDHIVLGWVSRFLEIIVNFVFESFIKVIPVVAVQSVVFGVLVVLVLHISVRIISWSIQQGFESSQFNIEEYLSRPHQRGYFLAIGFVFCWLLQSSSLTISLLLPLVSKKLVRLPEVLFFSLGAALATTCDPTQILSYLKFGSSGLVIGLTHILINFIGLILVALVLPIQNLILASAKILGHRISKSPMGGTLLIIYIILLFYLLPILILSFN